MYRNSSLFLITILTVWCIFNFFPIVNAVEIVIHDNHSSFVSSVGTFHVVGEVENMGPQSMAFVSITGTFYDPNNTIIVTESSFATLEIIPPGVKSPFEVVVTDQNQAEKVHNYTLAVTDSSVTTKNLTKTLIISSNSSYISVSGYLNIVGEVKNNGSSESTSTRVAATCYDENGKVVAIKSTFTDPQNLNPEKTAQFNLMIDDKNQSAKMDNYALQVQSSKAILIPEFTLSHVFIFLTLLFTIVIMRRMRGPRFERAISK
ncbi:FxLYD domain-containing protein [[Eubacterium] cellulosolvens]